MTNPAYQSASQPAPRVARRRVQGRRPRLCRLLLAGALLLNWLAVPVTERLPPPGRGPTGAALLGAGGSAASGGAARAYAAGLSLPTQTASPSPTATHTPLPPPTPAPTLTPIPDIDYVDQGIAQERDDLLAQVAALPVLTGTTTGTVVSGLTGGRVVSSDGRFSLGLRPGIVPTTDTVHIQLSVPSFPPGDPHATRGGYPLAFSYVLTATRGSDGARLEHFSPEAVLTWNIDPVALAQAGVQGFPLHVYTFDEAADAWQDVPSYWKAETSQLLAATPHFSLYSVGDGFDAVDNYVPTVNGFEVDLQSGAATVQYPINLPPGPGGFAPKITLSYNSTQVDRVDRTQQGPSSIGWGWSLSTNYIAASQHHFYGPVRTYDPWTASIAVDGINGDLVKGTDGYWHTADESYARVLYHPGDGTQSNDWWEAWDKDGTHYLFDQRAYTFDARNDAQVSYRWMLDTATDVHGNVVNYGYAYEDAHANLSYTPPTSPTISVAVYPYEITYGGNFTGTLTDKIQVTFELASRTIGTTNDIGTVDRNSQFYQSYRIDKITVARRQQATGAFTQLRGYELKQDYSTVLTNTAGDKFPHLTLSDIVPHGNLDGSSTLPATHFDYLQSTTPCCPTYPPEDWGHLWYVNNGYGGKIGFYYDAAGGDAPSWSRRVRAKRVKDGFDTLPDDPPHSVAYFYDYLGGAVADQAHSLEPSVTPVHVAGKEFRGYGWVRVQDPMGQVTDHYFSQDDTFKAKEWRVQTGKAPGYSDGFDTTPTATPNPNWTVSGPVLLTPDPDTTNDAWELDQGAAITRTVGLNDGADVSVRLRVENRSGVNPQLDGTWKLSAPNGDYWGLQLYPSWNGAGYDLLPQAIWSVNAVTGTRQLATGATLTPRWLFPLAPARWYRLQLHTSPDGRFALELYEDRTDSGVDNAAHKGYLQIKSGDAGDHNTTIPVFPTGQQWQFAQQVTTASGYAALADDYSETRTVYGQTDSTYADQTQILAAGYDASDWHVGKNNCKNMTIRFVPLTTQSSSLYGTSTQLGQTKRSQTGYTYDAYGNQAERDEYGDVAMSGDERSTIAAFATLSTTTSYIVDKVAQTDTYQGIGSGRVLQASAQDYYDNQALFGILKGDLTKQERVGVQQDGTVTADRSATQFVYDAYGNQTQQIDPDNHQPTITTYDPYYFAFPVQITHPNGRSESMAYDFTVDAVTSQTDMNGTVTHHQLDAFGRPAKTWIDGFGTQTNPNEQYFFQDLNQGALTAPFYISYQQLLTGTQTTWQTRWFDGLGRKIQDVTPRGDGLSAIVVDTTYTNTGVLSSTTWPYVAPISNPTATVTPDPSQPKTIHYYDGAGRPAMVVNPDSSSVIYDYSLLQWTAAQDESGHIHSQHTDLLGRLDQVQEYSQLGTTPPVVTGYGYDVLDRLQQVTRAQGDPLQTTSTVSYDTLGRKSQVEDPDLGTWSYGYDAAGNVLTQTDALGSLLLFSYDDMNRLTAKYYGTAHQQAGTPDVRYYYDDTYLGSADADAAHSWGRLRNVEVMPVQGSNANRHSYLYDPRGLPAADAITTTFNTQIYTVTYAYDVGGRLTTLTYPNATGPELVNVGYSTQSAGLPNLLTSSVAGNPAPVSDAAYNARGQLTTLVQGDLMVGNLLTTTLTYDDATTKRGWLTRTQVVTSTATLLDLNVGYAANGDVSSMTQQAGGPNSPVFTNTYSYDDLDRLASATSNLYANETYNFDALGRMTSRSIGGTSYLYTYGDSAHIDAPTAYEGNSYGYDANGSQTSGTVGGRNETRTFDPEHRVSRIVTTGASSATLDFVYDGNGKRVVQSVTSGSATTPTLYVGNLYEEQLTGGGGSNPYTVYYLLGAKPVALRRANWPNPLPNGQERLVGDHLGSTTLLVDTSNPPGVVQRQYYTPYGESAFQWTVQGNLTSRDFTGQRLDADSGLLYYGVRYYDPVLAYFISADPTTPHSNVSQSFNRFAYVFNNPIRFIDPLGYGPQDYYVFVNGCSVSSGSDNCGGDTPDWGEYYTYLKELYDNGGWGYAVDPERRYVGFEEWAASHIVYVHATDPNSGYMALDQALKDKIPATATGKIHLLGHSWGAAAIWLYLDESWMTERLFRSCPRCNRPGPVLDRRISDVTLIDGPLSLVDEPGLGAWVTSRGIKAVNVQTPNDIVHNGPISGIYANYESANYGVDEQGNYREDLPQFVPWTPQKGTYIEAIDNTQTMIEWHTYTFSNMAVETRDFLSTAWK